jgi:NRAMP (natural resistance-associated macrophage protein)-like metal ion transporter
MTQSKKIKSDNIEPGMVVETTDGADLGKEDVSKPRVEDVVQDQNGNVEKVIVTKGVIFKKKIEVPAERIEAVKTTSEDQASEDEISIDAHADEIQALRTTSEKESLAPENQNGFLDTLEQDMPTAEGLREKEFESSIKSTPQPNQAAAAQASTPSRKRNFLLHVIGPGFLAGMSGNDPSAVTAYAIDGANAGFAQLWLMLLSTPMYQAVQYACAKIGRVTQKGFSEILREHYGNKVALPASLVLLIANIALIAADLVAIGSGLQLLTGISWLWFVVPVALLLWYFTVYRNFETLKKIFIVLSLAFVVYIITAIFSHPDWGTVLRDTFVPQLSFGFADVSSAVALLGATISPYSMFWQMQGEKEEKRTGGTKQQLREAALDVAVGVVGGNLVSYFVIVATGATLFVHHKSINTATDAAKALQPLLGPFAVYLFGIGLIGAGLIAIPVLLASTSYAISGTFGWPAGLSRKPWQSEGFYLILSLALVISLIIALLGFSPIQLIFWANVLAGVLAPILVVYLLIVGNNRTIMKDHPLGLLTNLFLGITIFVLVAGAILLFYGLATGQGG